MCGVGTGTFALAPISNMILEKYGWRNVMRQAESMCLISETKVSPVYRTYSCFSGLGILAGATMLPVTSPHGKTISEDTINNNGEDFQKKKTNKVWKFLLGQNLASSKGLKDFFLFVLSDFLCFMSIYIAYVHLPIFVQVKNHITERSHINERSHFHCRAKG